MAKEQVVRLYRDIQSQPDLKAELNASPSIDVFVERARHYGYDFTIEEWQETVRFKVEELEGELSEIPGI